MAKRREELEERWKLIRELEAQVNVVKREKGELQDSYFDRVTEGWVDRLVSD